MKRIGIFVILIACFVSAAWAQQTTGKDNAKHGKPVYYDTFKEKWLDPAKWLVGLGQDCGRSLECVREIQNGHLRLALRNFGDTDSDSGDQWSWSTMFFTDPGAVNSTTADVTVRSFSGNPCPNAGWTHADMEMGGIYFNTGTGDPNDDLSDTVAFIVDTNNPTTVGVSNFMSGRDFGVSTDMGSYLIGTPLTATIAWDKENHQFISVVKVKGDHGPGTRVVVPYSVSDVAPPVRPQRWIDAGADSPNCTSAQTFVQVEAFYDNVMINQPAP